MRRWLLTLFEVPISRSVCVILIGIAVAGCGGIHRLSVYAPVAPVLVEYKSSFVQEGYWWVLDLVDVEVRVGPVVLSEELKWIVGPVIMIPAFLWEEDVPRKGPLEIYLTIKARSKTNIEFDPREFRVHLEDGAMRSPKGATPWPSSPDTLDLEPVVLSGEQEWRASLRYDVSRVGLKPFVLRLGVMTVNGRALSIPALSFEIGNLWHSS